MHERADRLAGNFVTVDEDLAREFEARLVESSTLAFRVAFSVLRQREDAEDVAQEAFAKAYRSFRQLRDRERFRAWLVRMTWRMAIDRQRANRRRLAREEPDQRRVFRPAWAETTGDTVVAQRARRAVVAGDRCAAREAAADDRPRRHSGARHQGSGDAPRCA